MGVRAQVFQPRFWCFFLLGSRQCAACCGRTPTTPDEERGSLGRANLEDCHTSVFCPQAPFSRHGLPHQRVTTRGYAAGILAHTRTTDTAAPAV
ncbi:hypothetical protein EI94DRAFT_1712343 [Lactarius quietus]|nr:hypothetical protein EI94DRAFT_1712343 [Lactarius quietus]